MNGVALLLAAASLAVDYSWDNSAGKVEYMVRVEPEVIPSLVSGEEIHSDVPAEAGTVERFRLRVGIDGNQPVFTPAAPGRLGAPADRSAVLVKSGGTATETQEVSFGWQPNSDGKLLYYVQIDPALLRTLEVGDEIQARVDTTAGPAATFVVFGGNKQLPRIPTGGAGAASTAGTSPPSRFSPEGETSPAAGQLGDSRFGGYEGGAAPAAATDSGTGSRFGGASSGSTTTGTNSNPPSSRFGGAGAAEPTSPPAGSSRFGGASGNPPPSGTAAGSGSSGFGSPRPGAFNPPALENPQPSSTGYSNPDSGRNSNTFNPGGSGGGSDLYPSNNQGNTYRNPTGQDPSGRTYDNRAALEPPQGTSANRPLPPMNPPANQGSTQPPPVGAAVQQPPPAGQNPNDRMAMVDPNTTRGAATGFPAQPTGAPAAATEAEKPWWWGWLVFFFCVMCLSIGGNLYLGWTAVEFYHRYQRAVERLRSSTSTVRA